MPLKPLGKINPTPGTPVPVTSLLPASGYPEKIHGILIQARRANTSYTFVGNAEMDPANDEGLHGQLAVPTINTIPSWSAALTLAPNAINLSEIYVDAQNPGDGVIVSVLIA